MSDQKANIEAGKADIEAEQRIFGRSDVMKVTGVKSTRASELLRMLSQNGLIEPVQGYGKGKYRFCGKA